MDLSTFKFPRCQQLTYKCTAELLDHPTHYFLQYSMQQLYIIYAIVKDYHHLHFWSCAMNTASACLCLDIRYLPVLWSLDLALSSASAVLSSWPIKTCKVRSSWVRNHYTSRRELQTLGLEDRFYNPLQAPKPKTQAINPCIVGTALLQGL